MRPNRSLNWSFVLELLSVISVAQDQIKQILGLDAKAKAVILTLIKLKRLAAQGRNDAGEQCYRFPVKTMV